MREAESRVRKAVEGCRGWMQCCQASSGLSVLSVIPVQAFAMRKRLAGWQAVAEHENSCSYSNFAKTSG